MARSLKISIWMLKENIDFYFGNINYLWDQITASKENQSPSQTRVEWLMVRRQFNLIQKSMNKLNPNGPLLHSNYNNFQRVYWDTREFWKTTLYCKGQVPVVGNKLHYRKWCTLQKRIKELRSVLEDMYLGLPC